MCPLPSDSGLRIRRCLSGETACKQRWQCLKLADDTSFEVWPPAWPAPTCSRCARSAACVLPAPSPIPRAFRDSYPPQRYATPLFTHALPPQATVLPPPAPIKMTNQQTELDQAVPVRTVATARSHCSAAARRLRPGQWQRTPLPRAPYPVARQKPSVSRQKPCPETLY